MNQIKDSRCFLLVGNGPLTNRGCQAIVLGTHQLLKQVCPAATFVSASFGLDSAAELPPDVKPVQLPLYPPRWSYKWVEARVLHRLGIAASRTDVLKPLKPFFSQCEVMLSVGGDNYAIDYGYEIVERLILIGQHARKLGIPQVIWGASIGPFDEDPTFEARLKDHFSEIDLIVVREIHSFRYLQSLGITENVVLAPDPSFLMSPKAYPLPEQITSMLRGPVIGLNLSVLLARYVSKGDLDEWTRVASTLVQQISDALGLPILLIPHVFCPDGEYWIDDAQFMHNVLDVLPARFRDKVTLLPGRPSAPELKWIIAQTAIFIGARTHSTLAALSSAVPCLSLAYSRKAHGINEWIFGHGEWSVDARCLTPALVADKAVALYGARDSVRQHLRVHASNASRDLAALGQDICNLARKRTLPNS